MDKSYAYLSKASRKPAKKFDLWERACSRMAFASRLAPTLLSRHNPRPEPCPAFNTHCQRLAQTLQRLVNAVELKHPGDPQFTDRRITLQPAVAIARQFLYKILQAHLPGHQHTADPAINRVRPDS